MKRVCLTVLCILLVGCGNAETAETEEKMRFENLDPVKDVVWALPRSLATTGGIIVIFFSCRY